MHQDKYTSFDTYMRFMAGKDADPFKLGKYIEYIDEFTSHASRKQLLVLGFDAVVTNPSEAMRQLTSHYGLPVLTQMNVLPEEVWSITLHHPLSPSIALHRPPPSSTSLNRPQIALHRPPPSSPSMSSTEHQGRSAQE